jgi:hypothetical protein
MPNENINEVALEALRIRITQVLPAQIRACIELLDEEQLWWRPNKQSNSVGNLVLHVRGAVMHFLCRGVGGINYERDRPREFAERSLTKKELLELFDDLVAKTKQTFAELDPARLSEPSTEPAYYSTVFEDILGVAVHMTMHTGQIVYVTKAQQSGSLNELWSKVHRAEGAWKS